MTDTNETSRARPNKTLTLKKTETSTVKQSFSHGRTKAVVVEKKRTLGPGAKPAVAEKAPALRTPQRGAPAQRAPTPAARDAGHRGGVVLRQLTDEEKVARSRALADARVAEDEARRRADEEARHRAVEEDRLKRERVAAEKRKAEEDARKAAEEQAKKHAEEEANRRLEKKEKEKQEAQSATTTAPPRGRRVVTEEEDETPAKKGAKAPAKAPVARKGEDNRRRGRLTVTRALSGDDERTRSVASFRRHLQRVNRAGQQEAPPPAGPRDITIPETITVAELANRMARRS